jgi:amino acid transporter
MTLFFYSRITQGGVTVSIYLLFGVHRGNETAKDGWAFLLAFAAPMWTLTGYDSAAHISEETSNAAFTAPIAIITGVAGSASLGWLFLIAASFASSSVSDLLGSSLPLPMGQLFLNTLGKRGMLAIWSLLIVVQVSITAHDYSFFIYISMSVRYWCSSGCRRLPSSVRLRA